MNYETLKAAVANVIKTNGNEEITGQLLQDVLIAIINALGSGYQFMGIATAETTPGTPDQRVFYLAGSAGSTVLPGFGITVDHEICVLMYSDEWEKQTLLQFDSVLTSGSQNLVTSGMVYDALTNLSQAIDGLAEIVGGHTTAIESLEETVGGHTTAIDDLQNAVVAIQAAIESLQTDVAQKIDKSEADSLVVGSAQGVLATSAVEAFFLFQQSGTTGNGAALIPTIKGVTKVINQLADPNNLRASFTSNGIVVTNNGDGSLTISGTATADLNFDVFTTPLSIPVGHLVYVPAPKLPSTSSNTRYSMGGNWYTESFINTTSSAITAQNIQFVVRSGNTVNIRWYVEVVDLTLAGFADYTLAQILALYPNGFGAYNPGVLKNNDAVAMITDGFNLWDEQWLAGYYQQDGTYISANNRICSKNWVPVFPNTTYFLKSPVALTFFFYDADKNFIEGSAVNITANTEFTTPANARWCLWYCTYTDYGNVYKNDICINISNPAKNGTYEPYWSRMSNFGLTGITGIPEGGTQDDRVTIFPDGLGGVGSAFDSIFMENGVTKARKTMQKVHLRELAWSHRTSPLDCFYANLNPTSIVTDTPTNNNKCSKYPTFYGSSWSSVPDKMCFVGPQMLASGISVVAIVDSAYANATTDEFKAAMDGVYLEYELATPIVYTDLQYADGTPFIMPQMFRTAQGGTMLIVSPEGATAPSAPFSADIIYPVDPIASSGASLKNLLEALKTATVITSYTMTFNSTTQQYEFTITK